MSLSKAVGGERMKITEKHQNYNIKYQDLNGAKICKVVNGHNETELSKPYVSRIFLKKGKKIYELFALSGINFCGVKEM